MDTAPAATAIPAEVSEAEFRREVRAELKHVREMFGHINATLDMLLAMAKHDEQRAEAEHG